MEPRSRRFASCSTRPERPFVAILGGAKVSDKIGVIDHLLTRSTCSSSAAGWPTRSCWRRARRRQEPGRARPGRGRPPDPVAPPTNGVRIVLPVDVIVAKEVTRGTEYKTLPAEKIPASWHIVDLGKASQDAIDEALADVQTVFWNGPLGVFEILVVRPRHEPSRGSWPSAPMRARPSWSAAAIRWQR